MGEAEGGPVVVAAELAEWREDVCEGGIGSQVVVLEVPRGWGRSALLGQVAADAERGAAGPVTLVARRPGTCRAARPGRRRW